MHLSPVRYGFLAGMSFLFALALMNWIFGDRPAETDSPMDRHESHVQEQLWRVLDEARRITEEACDGI
jgi:hypothetical protein